MTSVPLSWETLCGIRGGKRFHVHFSLLDEQRCNVFDNGTDEGSILLQQAVAGLLNHMSDSMLVFAPT